MHNLISKRAANEAHNFVWESMYGMKFIPAHDNIDGIFFRR